MHGRRCLVLVGCFLVSILGASVAKAGGSGKSASGTITFVGALVEPTCNISAAPDVSGAGAGAADALYSHQRSCSGANPSSTTASQTYSSDVVHLSNAESDQVLRYFAGYVRDAQASRADPVLVTQTYE